MMNDNYFDEFILQAIINKKYLSKKQRELLKQDVIEFEIKDPF
ncbi:MAG: C1 family peptidase [Bacilli bacterium]|nr:C1 family peptidase [Bacilli bacterium]